MLELLKSLVIAAGMVPVVMVVILGMVYVMGEIFNIISARGHSEKRPH